MPERVLPLSRESEKDLLRQLVEDLRENFGVPLSENLDFSRGAAACGGGKSTKYMLIGGNGAQRLGEALKNRGKKVSFVTHGGWRANKAGVEAMLDRLDEVELRDDCTAIFMPLDNNSFYMEDEEGGRSLPVKREDGIGHVVGRVEAGLEKTWFLFLGQPSGYFWFFFGFLGFFVFSIFCPEERVFRVFSVSRIL
jgi:hypothetical protein